MHPLAKAYLEYVRWLEITPRNWSPYWSMWKTEVDKAWDWYQEMRERFQ